MNADHFHVPSPRPPGVVLGALIAVAAAMLGLSVFLAFTPWAQALSARATNALQFSNLAISSLALALAGLVARKQFRRRGELRELITVCAWTRRVLWHGRWITFEEYLANQFNLQCTHGICEEAAERIRQDMGRGEL